MKEKKLHVAYNIQSAADYDTKLICTINVTQNPTDHYELPNIAERAIININTPPKIHECRYNLFKPNIIILLS